MTQLKTWKLKDRDLVFNNGNFVEITDNDALVQRLENRLKLWKGEFEYLPNEGIDYLDLFNSKRSEKQIAAVLKAELLKDPYITSVPQFDITLNRSTRVLSGTFKAKGNLGPVEGSVSFTIEG